LSERIFRVLKGSKMKKITILTSAIILTITMAGPAHAGGKWGGSSGWSSSTSSSSGGHGSTSSSGGSTSSGATPVPEPAQMGLFGVGFAALAFRRFRRRKG